MMVNQRASVALLGREQAQIYAMLNAAAERGEPCPVNVDLEMAVGFSSCSMASKIIGQLEAKGHIVVERSQKARRVMITATGKWTPWPAWHKAEVRRMDRGSHDDSFLIAALVEFGLERETVVQKVATLQDLNRLAKALTRCTTLVERRIGGMIRGEK
jgi:predicted transcriptional regulator